MNQKPDSQNQIHVNLDREEFRQLLELLYIATWVLEAHKTQKDPRTEPYSHLEQKFLAMAATEEFDDLVQYDEKFDTYFPTLIMEEGPARVFLDEYDNDTFWDELLHYLAQRDVTREVGGVRAYFELSLEEKLERLGRLEEFYAAEFEEHGVENLYINHKD